jgi:hypothetical protein
VTVATALSFGQIVDLLRPSIVLIFGSLSSISEKMLLFCPLSGQDCYENTTCSKDYQEYLDSHL